jgi:multiple sugar transport system ATP-binding protein
MATVTLKNITKSFGDVAVIKGIDLDIEDRSFVVFVGPSGCGKSTLLRLIAGLEEITSGDLLIDGVRSNDIQPGKRGLAMVFQSYALYPHMTVAENMAFSLKLSGMSREERQRRVLEAARVLELEPLLERKPKQLSGGQRQRVAIGRAIVREPRVFLFDEPLSNLDAGLRVQMRLEIARLHESLNTTMIYVTHDQVEAMTLADRIVVLRDGVIEQVGAPLELYRSPRNLFVAGFIGSPKMNLLSGSVISLGDGVVAVGLNGVGDLRLRTASKSLKKDDHVTIGVRAEHLSVSDEGQLEGVVRVTEHLGSETFLHVELGGSVMVTSRASGGSSTQVHDRVRVTIDDKHCHIFDANGNAAS